MNTGRLWLVALLLMCAATVPSPESHASSQITASKTILFTQAAGATRWSTVPSELVEMVSDRHYRSRAPVAPASVYVEVSQGGVSLGGCWSDSGGNIEFSSGMVLSGASPVRLTYSDTPGSTIAVNSIHRLTREGPESWPSLAISQSTIWLARAVGESVVTLESWTRTSGLLSPTRFQVGYPSTPARRPCVVAASTGEMLLICDRRDGGEYALERFSPPSAAANVIRSDSFPHSPAACSISSTTLDVRYSRAQGGSTHVSDHEMYFRSAGDSATLLYMQVPAGLSHLFSARASNGTIWTTGATAGQVTVYRGQQLVTSFAGETPVVSPVVNGGTQLIAILSGQAGSEGTVVSARLYDIWGFPVGAAHQVFMIPGTVTRLSAALLGETRLLIAWSQVFCGVEQVFLSSVDVRP